MWPLGLKEIKEELLRSNNEGFDELELRAYHFHKIDQDNNDIELGNLYDCIRSNISLKIITIHDLKGNIGVEDFVSLCLSLGCIPSLTEYLSTMMWARLN